MSHGPILKLFIKPGCPWCMQVITWLDEEGYRYKTLDVISDDSAFEEMKAISGQSLAPTLLVENEDGASPSEGDDDPEDTGGHLVLPDFGVEELRDFLKEHGIGPNNR